MDRILDNGWRSPSRVANKLDAIVDWINAHDEQEKPPGLVWSSEAPTVPGWYWMRNDLGQAIVEAFVYAPGEIRLRNESCGWNPCHDTAEYAGPIPPPSEPRHEGEAIG